MGKRPLLLGGVLICMTFGLFILVYAQGGNVLTSMKAPQAPVIDGQQEELWNEASSIEVEVVAGANMGETKVELRSVYTEDAIFFLAQWEDPTESLRRSPWKKQADGSWKKLKDPEDTGHDNNLYYEDKLAMIWNINDSIEGFNQAGCFVTCHAGENPKEKAFGSKYTAGPGEIGDTWHWKAVRTNPVMQIDDKYLDHTRFDSEKARSAGRKSDPKESGGYYNNQTEDGKRPQWALPQNSPAPPYWILDDKKVPFDDGKYQAADEVPGIVIGSFEGDRGDITAKGVYEDGRWTLEWKRKLDTDSPYDVQFSDLGKSYFFGVAVFDNSQVRHAYQMGVNELRFAK